MRRQSRVNLFIKYLITIVGFLCFSLLLGSCGPRDIHIKTLKQRLIEGEVYTLDKEGERLSTCLERDSDWQDLSIHENDYDSFILSEQIVVIQSGYKNCFRVGSKAYIKNDRISVNGSLGFVEIVGVSLLSVNQLQKERNLRAKGQMYALRSADIERVTNRIEPRHQGIVNTVIAKYVPGTSALEASIKQKQKAINDIESDLNLGTIITLENEGEILSSCGAEVWNEFRLHHTKTAAMASGQLRALLNRGVKNCHQIGQIVEVSTGGKSDKFGKVKVTKILFLSLETLKKNLEIFENEVTLQAINEDIIFLEDRLKNETFKNVNVIFFEHLGDN